MYDHILIAVDGSPIPDRALKEATKLIGLNGGKLRVITVVDSSLCHLPDYVVYYSPEPLREAVLKAADDVLAKTREKIETGNVESAASNRVHQERASEEIAERIELETQVSGADVMIMGTYGRRDVRHLMFGSVAEGLICVTSCPVLLIRDE